MTSICPLSSVFALSNELLTGAIETQPAIRIQETKAGINNNFFMTIKFKDYPFIKNITKR
jgi:hypothetical protein